MSSSVSSSSKFNETYKRYKCEVKKWEVNFREKNGRAPNKLDIKDASLSVRESYKMYFKLKTKILAENILGEIETIQRCKSDGVLKENTNILPLSDETINVELKNKIKNNESQNSKENSNSKNVETWGTHLNRSKTCSNLPVPSLKITTPGNLSKKLFGGQKFNKRNPRKSFTNRSSICSNISSFDTSVSFDNDVSNINNETIDSPLLNTEEISAELPFSVVNDCSPKLKALITTGVSMSPFLMNKDKFRIVSDHNLGPTKSVSIIQTALSESTIELKSKRRLDINWVDRCNEFVKETQKDRSVDSGFECSESSVSIQSPVNEVLDDDDIIGDSDSESSPKINLSLIFASQKRKFDDSFVEKCETKDEVANLNEDEVPNKRSKMDISVFDLSTNKLPAVNKTKLNIKEEILQNKIQQGTLNDNYVRINLKKKVFVRGKKNFNFSKHKKQQWKKKKKGLTENVDSQVGGVLRCFKCNEVGHYARYCQKIKEDKLLSEDEEEEDTLPTLEDAKQKAQETAGLVHRNIKVSTELHPDLCGNDSSNQSVEPLYTRNKDGSFIDTPKEVFDALAKFGHYKFRPGQEQAVMRILSGQSTLLTLSTGSGKSLCYQLPAYLYAVRSVCITLVVSPLVSLMEDQVSSSSSFFKLGCLHTNQTPKQREAVVEDVKSGKLCALLVSPEAVVSNDGDLGKVFSQLPPIAFACIDEVHCVSQWSHNFRPSYLMVNKVLREKYGVRTVLGLTATASRSTIAGIVRELSIPDGDQGVIKDSPVPANLCLSVSMDKDKDQALLALLRGSRFCNASAILVYCTRRDQCERLAVLIRTVMRDQQCPGKSGRARLSWVAEAYHAGMTAARRKQVQRAFMAGNLRIVVATVAFGMGINKSDIQGVVHYNMPKDLESYVQEVGRAGRDGTLAHCHLFLDHQGHDLAELRRHIYSNSVDRHTVRRLLQRVFLPCQCEPTAYCPHHEVAFECSSTIQALDLPEENISTLLCYLELHPKNFVKVLPLVYVNCKVQSYKGVKALYGAANKCPPLAVACTTQRAQDDKSPSISFNVIDVARNISWESGVVKRQLKNLEWSKTKEDKWRKSGMIVEFSELGFRVSAQGNLNPSEQDEALDYLVKRVTSQEERATMQLRVVFSLFKHFAEPSSETCRDGFDKEKSNAMKAAIRGYFETEQLADDIPLQTVQTDDFDEEAVASDVRRLICTYRDNSFNGRSVARIFHGIQSPNYPASLWFKCPMWRLHIDKDFNKVLRIATREILHLK